MSNKEIDKILGNIDDLIAQNDVFVEQNIDDIISRHEKTRRISKGKTIFEVFLFALIFLPTIPFSSNLALAIVKGALFVVATYFTVSNYIFYRNLEEQDKATDIDEFISVRHKITENGLKMLCRGRYLLYPLIIVGVVSNILYESPNFEGNWYYFSIVFVLVVALTLVIYLERSIREFERKLKSLK